MTIHLKAINIEQYFPVVLFVNAGQGDSKFCVCG